jgi:hypothetical protein
VASARKKTFALYWCTTPDGDEDWFVVASSAAEARRFHEAAEGYLRGEAEAERIRRLPANLLRARDWKDGPQGPVRKGACWPSDELLVACGGEVAPQPRDHLREIMGIVSKDVRFGDRVFRSGDHVENLDRTRGIKTARLSVFPGGRNK